MSSKLLFKIQPFCNGYLHGGIAKLSNVPSTSSFILFSPAPANSCVCSSHWLNITGQVVVSLEQRLTLYYIFLQELCGLSCVVS